MRAAFKVGAAAAITALLGCAFAAAAPRRGWSSAASSSTITVTAPAFGVPIGDLAGDHRVTVYSRCSTSLIVVGSVGSLVAACRDATTSIRPWAVPIDPAPMVDIEINGAMRAACRLSVIDASDTGINSVVIDCGGSTP